MKQPAYRDHKLDRHMQNHDPLSSLNMAHLPMRASHIETAKRQAQTTPYSNRFLNRKSWRTYLPKNRPTARYTSAKMVLKIMPQASR